MSEQGPLLKRVRDDLERCKVGFALVGGIAVGAWTRARATKDVDFAVAVDSDQAAERLVFELRRMGYVPAQLLEEQTSGRLATVRFKSSPAEDAPDLDLLLSSSGIEGEVVREASDDLTVLGSRVRVARPGHLLALKLLSENERRPQDAWDIAELISVCDKIEFERARRAIGLIAQRGFGRGKDLVAGLEKAIAASGRR